MSRLSFYFRPDCDEQLRRIVWRGRQVEEGKKKVRLLLPTPYPRGAPNETRESKDRKGFVATAASLP